MRDLDVWRMVVAALDNAGIPHMLTGSYAGMLYGRERMTADVDLVIDPPPGTIDRFLDALDADRLDVDRRAARRAVSERDMFNVLDTEATSKVDLIVCKDHPFSASEFGRRTPLRYEGMDLFITSTEDLVLAKLAWSALRDSALQREDGAVILSTAGRSVDDTYLDHWAAELGIEELLRQARVEAAR